MVIFCTALLLVKEFFPGTGSKMKFTSNYFYFTTTGCPEDESNFETYGNSGIGGAMRISFGLLRAGMCWFNYM